MKAKGFLAGVFALIPSIVLGAGLTQHQFMADIAYELVSNLEMADCLGENRNAYRVGASFPDCGYAIGNPSLSGDAHSPRFVNAFLDLIRRTYAPPFTEQYPTISFLLGAASHVADDPPYHAYFIAEVAARDFGGDYQLAHTMCDTGLEFVTILEHNRWADVPQVWLPMEDILSAFALMGSSHSREDILAGNTVLAVAGFAERLVTLFLYLPVKLLMPWGGANYYDDPQGGLFNGGERSAAYYESVWTALMRPPSVLRHGPLALPDGWVRDTLLAAARHRAESGSFFHRFARKCLEEGVVEVEVTDLEDGSVLIGPPKVKNPGRFVELLLE